MDSGWDSKKLNPPIADSPEFASVYLLTSPWHSQAPRCFYDLLWENTWLAAAVSAQKGKGQTTHDGDKTNIFTSEAAFSLAVR